MSWLLPPPLLLCAGVVALWPLTFVLRRPTSAMRLLVEAYVAKVAVIAAFWLAWVAYWVIEQRR